VVNAAIHFDPKLQPRDSLTFDSDSIFFGEE
jgi:hypothetical protein